MLHLLLGTDWTANRDEILRRISLDVNHEKMNRILENATEIDLSSDKAFQEYYVDAMMFEEEI